MKFRCFLWLFDRAVRLWPSTSWPWLTSSCYTAVERAVRRHHHLQLWQPTPATRNVFCFSSAPSAQIGSLNLLFFKFSNLIYSFLLFLNCRYVCSCLTGCCTKSWLFWNKCNLFARRYNTTAFNIGTSVIYTLCNTIPLHLISPSFQSLPVHIEQTSLVSKYVPCYHWATVSEGLVKVTGEPVLLIVGILNQLNNVS